MRLISLAISTVKASIREFLLGVYIITRHLLYYWKLNGEQIMLQFSKSKVKPKEESLGCALHRATQAEKEREGYDEEHCCR